MIDDTLFFTARPVTPAATGTAYLWKTDGTEAVNLCNLIDPPQRIYLPVLRR